VVNNLILLSMLLLFLDHEEPTMNNSARKPLEAVRQGRIFFGHQSVGSNILQGIREIAGTSGEEAPAIVEVKGNVPSSGSFLAEAHIGANGDPASKCADWLRMTTAFPAGGLDVAMMKFCYVDFTPKTNADEIFQLYRRTVDSLKSARPRLIVVHCTAPLTARAPLWKRFARWVLGREDYYEVGNVIRMRYNDLLLAQYGNEPIFDIAKYESTLPDGSRCSFTKDGKVVYAMSGQYTDDLGHLNQPGRRVVSAEFIKVLSEALSRKNR
jgi:hypothetical protein